MSVTFELVIELDPLNLTNVLLVPEPVIIPVATMLVQDIPVPVEDRSCLFDPMLLFESKMPPVILALPCTWRGCVGEEVAMPTLPELAIEKYGRLEGETADINSEASPTGAFKLNKGEATPSVTKKFDIPEMLFTEKRVPVSESVIWNKRPEVPSTLKTAELAIPPRT